MMLIIILLVEIYIIDITVELPHDITAVPQTYKVNCIIAGRGEYLAVKYYYDDNNADVELTTNLCSDSDGFQCTTTLDIGDVENGVSHLTSRVTPNALRHGLLTVTWEAEEIDRGIFRQDNNDGDHIIKCGAQGHNIDRTSYYIIVRGKYFNISLPTICLL